MTDDFEKKISEAMAKIGMVYLVRDDANMRVKIGTAMNPLARLRDLQTGSSVELRLVAIMPGGRRAEKLLHEAFERWHIQGEWFEDSSEDVSRCFMAGCAGTDGIIWPTK